MFQQLRRLERLAQPDVEDHLGDLGDLTKEFGYKNPMVIPRPLKIVVNMGVGEAIQNAKILDVASQELAAITGQKPIIRRAKNAIAAFHLRAGMPIGLKVTLRRDLILVKFPYSWN